MPTESSGGVVEGIEGRAGRRRPESAGPDVQLSFGDFDRLIGIARAEERYSIAWAAHEADGTNIGKFKAWLASAKFKERIENALAARDTAALDRAIKEG